MSHSHGNRADETVNVNDESITVLTEAALAVGSTEVLGGCFLTTITTQSWSRLLVLLLSLNAPELA